MIENNNFFSQSENEWTNNVLVIISNRFGLQNIGREYFRVIKKYMKQKSFVGLVGGKPRAAYFFVGHLEKPAGDGAQNSSAQ